jgi:PAS domain S-box-containing protein
MIDPTASQPPRESQQVEALRGLACVLLVAFHVIGSEPTTGLHAAEGSLYRQFAHLFQHLRMPLFTFLSGFVYAYRPLLPGQLSPFAGKKLLRLMLPLLCVSTLYYVVASVTPGASGQIPLHEAWRIYAFPYVHFWFLQAIIIIFAAVMVLERFGLIATPVRYAAVLAATVAIHLSVNLENDEFAPFSILQAAYLAPFFVLGLGANRFRYIVRRPDVTRACVAVFLVSMTVYAMTVWLHHPLAQRGSVLGLLIGTTGALTLLRVFPSWKPLAVLGAYSFAVYLFHPFFVGGTRTALQIAGVSTSTELLFAVGLVAGLIGPAVLEHVLGGVPIVSRMLFGQSAATGGKRKRLRHAPMSLPANIDVTDGAATMTLPAEILEWTHDAIIIWELNGAGIVYWNRAAEDLYGFTREQAQGQVTHELLKTQSTGGTHELETKLARYGVWVGDLRHTCADGRRVDVEARLSLMSQKDRPWLVLEINRDVTDRNRAASARADMERQLRTVRADRR